MTNSVIVRRCPRSSRCAHAQGPDRKALLVRGGAGRLLTAPIGLAFELAGPRRAFLELRELELRLLLESCVRAPGGGFNQWPSNPISVPGRRLSAQLPCAPEVG